MADRFPLILNTSANQIQEIASGDTLDLSGNNVANAGIITAGNVIIGAASTDLIVNGDARITGILTIGTSSLKLDGPNNLVNVGTALTLGHTQGLQFHTQNLHSAGFEVNQINVSGASTIGGNLDANGDLDVDGHTNLDNVNIAGITTTNDHIYIKADNKKLFLGGSQELSLWHNGTDSFIKHTPASGGLYMGGKIVSLNNQAASRYGVAYFENVGDARLYWTGTDYGIRIKTTQAGIEIPLDLDVDGHTNLDNVSIAGVTTFTGNIDANGELDVDGPTHLDYVSISGVTTHSDTVHIIDDKVLMFGSGGDSTIEYDENGTDQLTIAGAVTRFTNTTQSTSKDTGSVIFEGGIGVEKDLSIGGNVSIGGTLTYEDVTNIDSVGIVTAREGVFLPDLKQLKIGNTSAAPDLYLWHNSSTGNSNISNKTGDLFIQGNNGSGTVVNQIAVKSNAAVEINYQGNKKVETTSGGVLVTGDVDSTTGIFERTTGFTSQLKFKDSNETQLIHGSNGQVLLSFVGTGNAARGSIDAQSGFIRIKNAAGETGIICRDGSSTDLHHSGNKKLETSSGGISVTGGINLTTNLSLVDNGLLKLGTNDDIHIYHSGSHSYLKNTTNYTLWIQNNDSQAVNISNNSGGNVSASFNIGGAAQLYHANSKKFETVTQGAYIVGDLGVGDATNPTHQYDQGIHVHANGTGAVLHLTDQTSGSGTGDGFDIISHAGIAYLWQRENANMVFGTQGTSRWSIYGSNGHFAPNANNTYDIGTSSNRVRNIYTNDLNLSNEGSKNDVDGTWGNYTIQEGESDLFLINKRNGKKYKFNLTEVA